LGALDLSPTPARTPILKSLLLYDTWDLLVIVTSFSSFLTLSPASLFAPPLSLLKLAREERAATTQESKGSVQRRCGRARVRLAAMRASASPVGHGGVFIGERAATAQVSRSSSWQRRERARVWPVAMQASASKAGHGTREHELRPAARRLIFPAECSICRWTSSI
jgi:hypothetical protein